MTKLRGKLAGWIGLLVVDLDHGGLGRMGGRMVVDAQACPVRVRIGWHLALPRRIGKMLVSQSWGDRASDRLRNRPD